MKRIYSFIVYFILGIGLFWGALKYMANFQELGEMFFSFPLFAWFIIFSLSVLAFILQVFSWREVLKSQGTYFSIKELIPPYLACFTISYIVPVALFWADFFRAKVLVDKKGLAMKKGVASVFIDRIFRTIINIGAICIGSGIFLFKSDIVGQDFGTIYLGFIIFSAFILIFILTFLFYSKLIQKISIFQIITNGNSHYLGEGIRQEFFKFFKKKNIGFFLKGTMYTFLKTLVLIFQVWALIWFLGYTLDSFSTLAVFGASSAALETPVSADLGTHDFTTALVFESMEMRKSAGIVFALILRGVNLILASIGVFFLGKLGFQLSKSKLIELVSNLNEKQGNS